MTAVSRDHSVLSDAVSSVGVVSVGLVCDIHACMGVSQFVVGAVRRRG
jgi:hypothetical protein